MTLNYPLLYVRYHAKHIVTGIAFSAIKGYAAAKYGIQRRIVLRRCKQRHPGMHELADYRWRHRKFLARLARNEEFRHKNWEAVIHMSEDFGIPQHRILERLDPDTKPIKYTAPDGKRYGAWMTLRDLYDMVRE